MDDTREGEAVGVPFLLARLLHAQEEGVFEGGRKLLCLFLFLGVVLLVGSRLKLEGRLLVERRVVLVH